MSARNFENIAENDVAKRNCFNIGFTTEVPYYMRLADLLIGKPGPGVIAEAVHCNLPALVDVSKNSVFPQERDVLEWIDEVDIGTFFRSLSDFKRKISSIGIEDLTRRKEKTASIHNNALFEAAVVIEMELPKTPVIRPKRRNRLHSVKTQSHMSFSFTESAAKEYLEAIAYYNSQTLEDERFIILSVMHLHQKPMQ